MMIFLFPFGGICKGFVPWRVSAIAVSTKVSRQALLQYLLGMRGSFSHDALSDVLVSELQFQQILYLAQMTSGSSRLRLMTMTSGLCLNQFMRKHL